MTYQEWLEKVPQCIKEGPVWKSQVYPKALFLFDLTWQDCEKLLRDLRGKVIAKQLIRSVGSISANLEEGFGRGIGGKQYAYFLQVALGSAREAQGWYYRGRRLLSPNVVEHRLKLLEEIISLLVSMVRRQKNLTRNS